MTNKRPKRKPREGVDEYGRTPLHDAAVNGDISAAERALEAGLAIDLPDDDGHTPLHFSVIHNRLPLVKFFLERGANPNILNLHGNGPLWTAVLNAKGNFEIIELLLNAAADPDAVNKHGRSPKQMADTIGHGLEIVFSNQRRA